MSELKEVKSTHNQRMRAALAAAINSVGRQHDLLGKPRRYHTEADAGIELSMMKLLLDVEDASGQTELTAPSTQSSSAEGVGSAAVADALEKVG